MTGLPDPAAELPGDAGRTELPARVVPYWRLGSTIVWVPIVAVAVAVAVAIPGFPPVIGVVLVLVALALAAGDLAVQPKRRSVWWYAIGEEQIDLEHGWLLRTRTVVPMTRVQHVELQHGPLADRFDLAQLTIHTAAGTVTIPALDRGEGDRIRQRIADLARIADDL